MGMGGAQRTDTQSVQSVTDSGVGARAPTSVEARMSHRGDLHQRQGDLTVAFHGVRGSTPCSCPTVRRYGGNTSCVSLETPDGDPFVFDLGTGLRPWGATFGPGPHRIHAFVSHLHWDHVQGLPFFVPLHRADTRLDVYGPGHAGESMGEAFARFMCPPFFPVQPGELAGTIVFHDVHDETLEVADATVTVRRVPHTDTTNGYRIERAGRCVAYVSDHQELLGDPDHVDEGVLELCEGADLLIHDAQFTPDELVARADWGHCTARYAVEVARRAGVHHLVLFHHDPGRHDDALDVLCAEAAEQGRRHGIVVSAAAEGLKITL